VPRWAVGERRILDDVLEPTANLRLARSDLPARLSTVQAVAARWFAEEGTVFAAEPGAGLS